jgi:hypothetical protein
MATKSWKAPANGIWSDRQNWTGGTPGPLDTVLIQSHGAGESPYQITGTNAGSPAAALTGGTVVLGDTFATLALVAGSTLTASSSLNIGYAYDAGTITANGGGSLLATDGVFKVKGTSASAVQFDGIETFNGGTLTDAGGLIVAGGTFTETAGLVSVAKTASFNAGSHIISGGTFNTGNLSIGSGATLSLTGGTVTQTIIDLAGGTTAIANGGTLAMGGGTLVSTASITDNGIIVGSGKLAGALTGNGIVRASGGTLDLASAITANAPVTFQIDATSGSVLELDGLLSVGNSFHFLGASGSLLWNQPILGFSAGIEGLNVGTSGTTPTNFIDIAHGVTVLGNNAHTGASATIALSDLSTITLTGITGNNGGTWFVDTADDGHGGTEIFLSTVCFAAGTRILTTDGEKPVESLSPGDLILTLSNNEHAARPIIWIGRRRIDLRAHPRPQTVAPIRIRRGAFADNVPHRDLLLSPDHAIFVDGKLIAARQLVNGATITQEKDWSAIEYFHVELDQHAILLAEGLPAETYLDTGNRGFFANAGAPLILHPDLMDEQDNPDRAAGSCVPFVWDEPSVRPVWQRLLDRAATLGIAAATPATTTDAGLRVMAQGSSLRPVLSEPGRLIVVLPRGAAEVHLVSRTAAPADTRPWLDDRRSLGVNVSRLILRDAEDLLEIPVDHPALAEGWWSVERHGPALRRWTNGAARLPLPRLDGPAMLEIHLTGEMIYPVSAAEAEAKVVNQQAA